MSKITTVSALEIQLAAEQMKDNDRIEKTKSLVSRQLSTESQVAEAAGSFEALLLHQLLKAMWSTVEKTNLFGEDSFSGGIYQDMLHQAISDTVAEGRGIGVKDFLQKELLKTVQGHHNQGGSEKTPKG